MTVKELIDKLQQFDEDVDDRFVIITTTIK